MKKYENDPSGLVPLERDACAIICFIAKNGLPSHGNLQRTVQALVKMGHRAGEINGEGDGCGILTAIPRLIWGEILATAGRNPRLADSPGFVVGHLLIDRNDLSRYPDLRKNILQRILQAGLELVVVRAAPVVLGARVPIVLTSRADSVRTRLASCAVAALDAGARRSLQPKVAA